MSSTYTVPSGTADGSLLTVSNAAVLKNSTIVGTLADGPDAGLATVEIVAQADGSFVLAARTLVAGDSTSDDVVFTYTVRNGDYDATSTLRVHDVVTSGGLSAGNIAAPGLYDGQIKVNRGDDVPPWSLLLWDDTRGQWRTLGTMPLIGGTSYGTLVLADAPLAYWPLDESSPGAAHDLSGHSLTLSAAGAGITAGQPGPRGDVASMLFSGASTALFYRSGANGLPTGQEPWTLECWLNRDPADATGNAILMIGARFGPFGSIYTLHADGPTGLNPLWGSYDLHLGGLTDMRSSWHHYVVTFDGLRRTVYLDGALAGADGGDQTGEDFDASEIRLGGDGGDVDGWNGLLCQVAVYPTALSQARVLAHYNAMLSL